MSGNSDTTSGCESGGPSCEDSDEAEDPERPINNSSDKKKRSNKVSECRTNSSNSFTRPEEEEEEEEEEVETPKAVDPTNFMVRGGGSFKNLQNYKISVDNGCQLITVSGKQENLIGKFVNLGFAYDAKKKQDSGLLKVLNQTNL